MARISGSSEIVYCFSNFRNDFFEQKADVAIAEAVVFQAAIGMPARFPAASTCHGRD